MLLFCRVRVDFGEVLGQSGFDVLHRLWCNFRETIGERINRWKAGFTGLLIFAGPIPPEHASAVPKRDTGLLGDFTARSKLKRTPWRLDTVFRTSTPAVRQSGNVSEPIRCVYFRQQRRTWRLDHEKSSSCKSCYSAPWLRLRRLRLLPVRTPMHMPNIRGRPHFICHTDQLYLPLTSFLFAGERLGGASRLRHPLASKGRGRS